MSAKLHFGANLTQRQIDQNLFENYITKRAGLEIRPALFWTLDA
jgi:hypothetical protein